MKRQPAIAVAVSGPPRCSAAVAWVMLDWAASAFSTMQITLIVAYVERVVFADKAWGLSGGVVWAWTMAVAMLVSAAAAPFLSAWADRTRRHKTALLASVAAGSLALLTLGAVPPVARLAVAASIIVAVVGFDMAAIFTGSLLPRIASGRAADRLSASGFAAGYAGGAVALLIATAVVAAHDRLGLTAPEALRVAFVFTGCWWLLFSLPAAWARFGVDGRADGRADGDGQEVHASSSTGELLAFARSLAGQTVGRENGDVENAGAGEDGRSLGRVLLGCVLVLGAVQTAIAQFSSVALEEFHLDGTALVWLVLLVQAVALPGALIIGWLSARWSRDGAMAVCLLGWMIVLALACLVQTPTQLHWLAALLALVLGGVQSVIRALVAEMAPRGRFGATFGLMQVGTKLSGFVASLLFGAVLAASGLPRAGLVILLVQIAAGWWFLKRRR
ncbi:MAG: MFS transporter [Planctomycetia bacterium]|nr:MFS transporter [Planctomycetia bacterium]